MEKLKVNKTEEPKPNEEIIEKPKSNTKEYMRWWNQHNKEKRKAYNKKYYDEKRETILNGVDKDEQREYMRNYYEINKEKIKEYKKNWWKNNNKKETDDEQTEKGV